MDGPEHVEVQEAVKPERKRVPCVCKLKCAELTYVSPSGAVLPGQLVHPSTRLAHRKKEEAQSLSTSRDSESLPIPNPAGLHVPDSEPSTRPTQSSYHLITPEPLSREIGGLDEPEEMQTRDSTLSIESSAYIQTAVCLLAAWLHLVGGLSRQSVNITLKTINIIALLVFNLGYAHAVKALGSSPNTPTALPFSLPEDVRTAMLALSLEPTLIRIICCPKCFKNYREEDIPATGICGFKATTRILAALGDLLAMRKALGFAGVGSNAHFCSFCHLHKDDIEELDVHLFIPRIGSEVIASATRWRNATTKKARNEIFARHGVRWSSLHLLHYRDPVKHTVLGVMHNWIEGVLQHHVRNRWGIGADTKKSSVTVEDKLDNMDVDRQDIIDSDGDVIMMDGNSGSITLDFEGDNALTSALPQWHLDDGNSDTGSDDSGYQLENGDGEEEEGDGGEGEGEGGQGGDDDDDDEGGETLASTFTPDQLAMIRSCLCNAVIPSWVERPPTNLGEKSHGKLKADNWLKLFTVFLPLILPEIWTSDASSTSFSKLLSNFHSLVLCTHKVCAYDTSDDDADLYLHHYILYRRSSQFLFPHAPSRPNHHYAMHNVELLKYWGPLIRLSEFPLEQKNGMLQKIKTNNHLWELDYTMLRQICKRGRLSGSLQKYAQNQPHATPSSSNFDPDNCDSVFVDSLHTISSTLLCNKPADSIKQSNLQRLDDSHYSVWLAYMNNPLLQQPVFRDHTALPHPEGACYESYL
ncbi:hypothetical protein CVT24_011113 [Panaeolus cyanescens]|uniref:Uncharacterized protein n=1 Tax=Panaeolus cyanescens TaxID=181874 RepID=A0A409YG41_9AGAR|nr:hypothetical protein CVT24_011113 [Panaeolus cyanescens]